MLQLIHLVDSRALAQTLVRIIKVHNTDPTEIIKEMETIFSAYGTLAQKEKGKFGVSFLPVSRINAVMVLATSPALMERALYWTKQLDLKTDLLANIHVYNVVNYKAKNLANILTQVYGGARGRAHRQGDQTRSGPGLWGLSLSAAPGVWAAGAWAAQRHHRPGRRQGATAGPPPAWAPAAWDASRPGAEAAGAPALKERAVAGAGAPGAAPKEGVRIIPDEENNLLVVVAPPHEWNIISRVLKDLDIMPRQVLNEVLIAEVSLTDDLKYGIEFLLGGRHSTGTTTEDHPQRALVQGGNEYHYYWSCWSNQYYFHGSNHRSGVNSDRGPRRHSPPPGASPLWPWTRSTS